MSTRDALIQKLDKQPEWVLKEMYAYLDFVAQNMGQAKDGWPKGYFEETAGAFANEPFERPSQLPLEKREEW